MGMASTLLTVAALAGPPVEVSTFAGGEIKGEMTALKDGQLTISTEGKEETIALGDVLELRLGAKPEDPNAESPVVTLTDGSQLTCQNLTADQDGFTVETALGSLKIPKDAVGSVRLAPQSNALEDAWEKLTERQLNDDMLVIPKGNLLDNLKGIVGEITPKLVNFTLGNQMVPVDREKVFGVVYGNRKPPANVAISRAMLPGGDQVELKSLTWTGEAFEAELVAGPKIALAPDKLISLDFSLGKVQYLSDIQPRNVELELPFYLVGEPISEIDKDYYSFKVNKNFSGKPLQLGKTLYARGLCIHPKTELTYRLSKEMRRFQAMMGIDNYVAQRGLGDVKVTIKADDKILLETIVKAGDEPQKLDLDVTDVVVFEILVESAGEDDIGVGDHLNLADAKFIK